MEFLPIILGVVLLFAGRNLFWFFLGAVGFVAGMKIATIYLTGLPPWVALAVAMVAGLIGIAVAIFSQSFSIAVAGFISGAYLTYNIPDTFGYQPLAAYQLVVLIGAVVGTVLALMFFDWALIIFSALVGVVLIVQSVPMVLFVKAVVFAILAGTGVAVQARGIRQKKDSA
jgi:hypothetical protein